MPEAALREQLAMLGASLFQRGFSVGSAGNISVCRLPDGYLMTPTNSCLGRLDPAHQQARPGLAAHGGDKPSKEVFMHRAVLTARPEAGRSGAPAFHPRHGHCLRRGTWRDRADPPADALLRDAHRSRPAGDPVYSPRRRRDGAPRFTRHRKSAKAVLLANHGPVVSGKSLEDAVHAAEGK